MIKKGGKSEHFFVTHKHFFKKISIILVLFWQKNKHCFWHLMLFLRALAVRAYKPQTKAVCDISRKLRC